jgi:hypothetical protein
MTDFPFTWPYSFFPALKTLEQPINPGWSFGGVNVNYQGNPSIERDVIEKVASYGKQLGIISEAILELAGDKPKHGERPIARLREIVARIEALKSENKAALEREARSAMARLAEFEPAKARSIAAGYAKKPA